MICIACVGNESSKKPFLTFLKFGLNSPLNGCFNRLVLKLWNFYMQLGVGVK